MKEPQPEIRFHHFSHDHPLELTNSPPKENITCFGCKLNMLSSTNYYKCRACPFWLHHVCYNMPRNVQHPADPDHQLTLLATPSSTKGSFKCKACGHYVTGFYYNCDMCGDFYHALCSAVPLSVNTPFHPHTLRLEFSPPYEFQCDLCSTPGNNWWLYHCEFCEFDAHLACVISNKGAQLLQHQPVPQSNSSDNDLRERSKGHELMELLIQGVKGIGERTGQEIVQDQSKFQNPSIPLSEDLTISSYQFSDACFSIDFTKSLLGGDQTDIASRESSHSEMDNVKVKEKGSCNYTILPNGIMGDSEQAKKDPVRANKMDFESHDIGSKNGLNVELSTGIGSHIWMELGKENEKREANVSRVRSDVTIQNTKSNTLAQVGTHKFAACIGKLNENMQKEASGYVRDVLASITRGDVLKSSRMEDSEVQSRLQGYHCQKK
ncbi:uncharacterized protein LOC132314760 [Cornus florida]|uniref:uncharacterized protein LOC132314760 n=1 Tax=Cornus florida TaxID=4283 RepID=UPI00289EE121|nr:uncharacterized protein LOC132314760 [Cornus florida]